MPSAARSTSRALVFVAIVSAAADIASVFHPSGPSSAIAQSKAALSLLALPWPMLGSSNMEPFLGVGDVVFTALYVASTRRHALPVWRTLLGLTLGYALTMVTVVALEVDRASVAVLGPRRGARAATGAAAAGARSCTRLRGCGAGRMRGRGLAAALSCSARPVPAFRAARWAGRTGLEATDHAYAVRLRSSRTIVRNPGAA